MILGTQWYILFNVIAGAAAIPAEMRYVAANFASAAGCGGAKSRCRRCCRSTSRARSPPRAAPGTPRIVAEVASWGNTQVQARGLGAYIAEADDRGRFPPHRARGSRTMSLFVVVINRLFWRPLYYYAERKFRLT